MSRETRANLLFLIVFVALCVPGAVILFKKKLNPTAKPMYLPDPVRRQVPYMEPLDTPPQAVRVTPPLTAAWTKQLGGRIEPPLMSASRAFQVLSIQRTDARTDVRVLVWDAGCPTQADRLAVTFRPGDGGRIVSAEARPLPADMRTELRDAGFIRPPGQAVLLDVTCDRGVPPGGALTIVWDSGGARQSDTAPLP